MAASTQGVFPISSSERYVSLDALRGFAILGILIMNIQSFSMIQAAYLNPSAYGDLTGANRVVWMASHILADSKFMTIFSILFGAGVILFTNRLKQKTQKSAAVYYRRTIWLLVFGFLHAYLFWYGDILVNYAICGLFLYLFRKLSSKKLLIIGSIFFCIPFVLYMLFGFSMSYWPAESIEGLMVNWLPGPDAIQNEIAVYQGGWIGQMSHRVPAAMEMQSMVFLMYLFWRNMGVMLLGMALFKWGVLTAERSRGFYLKMMVFCGVIGVTLVSAGIRQHFEHDWAVSYSMFQGVMFNYWGSALVALFYIGLIMLLSRALKSGRLIKGLSAIGRMAFTNYILQTIICTTIFYGHGFGLFGKIDRWQQVIFVICVWFFQWIFSSVWFRYFKIGPLEWLWRFLTYLKAPEFKIRS